MLVGGVGMVIMYERIDDKKEPFIETKRIQLGSWCLTRAYTVIWLALRAYTHFWLMLILLFDSRPHCYLTGSFTVIWLAHTVIWLVHTNIWLHNDDMYIQALLDCILRRFFHPTNESRLLPNTIDCSWYSWIRLQLPGEENNLVLCHLLLQLSLLSTFYLHVSVSRFYLHLYLPYSSFSSSISYSTLLLLCTILCYTVLLLLFFQGPSRRGREPSRSRLPHKTKLTQVLHIT